MTTNLVDPRDSITPEEADRLASHIRPSWEIDDGDEADLSEALARAGSPAITTEGAPISDGSAGNPTAVVAKTAGSSPAGAPTGIPSDTVVDSGPPGKTNPPSERQDASASASSTVSASAPAPAPATAVQPSSPPKPAQATRVGLGDEILESVAGPAIVSARIVSIGDSSPAPPMNATTGAPATAAFPVAEPVARPVSDPPVRAAMPASDAPPPRTASSAPPPNDQPSLPDQLSLPPRRAVSVSDAPPAQSSAPPAAYAAPEQASFSRADEPIDIPVQRTSRALLFAIAGVVVLGAIVGGIAFMSGSDTKPDSKATSAPTSQAAKTDDAQKAGDTASKPAETATAQTAVATAAETATAKPADTSAATATAAATAAATSKPDVPQKSADSGKPKSSGGSSSQSGQTSGSKKPPKTGGGTGIIRDAPF